MVMISVASPSALAAECEECHTGNGSSGGYVFERPTIVAAVDPVIPPVQGFPFGVILRPGAGYDITAMNATLVLSPPSGPIVKEGAGTDGTVSFEIPGMMEGYVPYNISVTYSVYNGHATAGAFDRVTYREYKTGVLSIREMACRIDCGFLILDSLGTEMIVNVTATEDAYDLRVEADRSLAPYLDVESLPKRLSAGQTAQFSIKLLHRGGVEGNLTVSWYANGSLTSYPIHVTLVPEEEKAGRDLYHELGKYFGIASLALLLIGYFTGGTGFLKRSGNRLFRNAARRTKFHCAMSYELLVLSLFHFAVLFYGPFSRLDQILIWQTVLGIIAMGLMIVIAVNGINQKRFVKAMGFANWKRIHAWGTYIATMLVVIHALTIGSEFLWFRDMFGM
jgi:hypothetical protein